MSIAFVRHGETDWNAAGRLQGSRDIALNANGIAQAERLGELLADRVEAGFDHWRGVVTSPLVRAASTAALLVRTLGIPLLGTYAGLVERDYGPFEGQDVTAIRPFPDRDYPGAERIADLRARGTATLLEIDAEHGLDGLLVVSHGTLLRDSLMAWGTEALDHLGNAQAVFVERTQHGFAPTDVRVPND
ncbi:MAG TPA: histidine phosphatase family protein [Candidatus Lumbricidophila sp.]|nr:histidine phosphatase family protein [Candidatus Lumbricidophila sp.]